MYDKANQLYHNKDYDSASRLYEQMIHDGYCYADLFYNAGNAYYRLNKIGLAIWSYEKALKIQENKNYTDNLLLAKKRIKEPIDEVNDIFFIRWWKNLYQLLSPNTWAVLALVLFLISFSLLFLKKLKSSFSVSGWMTSLLFLISGFSLLMSLIGSYNETYHYQAIVIEPKTLFTYASKKEPVFISEGIKVDLVDISPKMNRTNGEANYVIVKLPDGQTGRIDRKSIKKID
jgi:tetratricopeptide (TPR) repeat protein